ncbi:MAG: tetratricopeptide repeat protein, partial [Thermodesulfobacteriota bacterium]|nr:tetratricopeptide repeat protein [Thermodesulfobacteriota bacterium]
LAIQKATVLEPGNSSYHLIFSRVLKRLGKLNRAEKEAGLAIKHSARPSASLFNHRAWIKWSKKDYRGALEDWKSAISLSPKAASYYARSAEAHYRLAEWSRAADCYKKAMSLDPKNKKYRKRYKQIIDQYKED